MVCYGRIGTEGHELTKTFEGSVAASKGTEKLITEKLGKGYREVSEAEAEIAHTAARSVSGGEGMPVGFSRKTRRFAKGKASGVQLCLSFIPEGKLEIVPPASLSLEF